MSRWCPASSGLWETYCGGHGSAENAKHAEIRLGGLSALIMLRRKFLVRTVSGTVSD